MDIKETNFSDWENREPDEESQKKVRKGFIDYFKKVTGKIPFAEDVIALYLLFIDPQYPLIKKGICVFALVSAPVFFHVSSPLVLAIISIRCHAELGSGGCFLPSNMPISTKFRVSVRRPTCN